MTKPELEAHADLTIEDFVNELLSDQYSRSECEYILNYASKKLQEIDVDAYC